MQVERWLRRFGVVLIAALAITWSAPASAQTPTQRGATVTRRVIDRGAARRSIYLENQYLDVPAIIERIEAALTRSVEVVAVVPAEPIGALVSRARAALGQHENFTLAGIAGLGADGRRKPINVHDKVMLIDDRWATVGSSNLHAYSLFGSSELNVAFSDSSAVRDIRCRLFMEHLGEDVSTVDDRTALMLFRTVAIENRKRLDAGEHAWQGLAFPLDVQASGV